MSARDMTREDRAAAAVLRDAIDDRGISLAELARRTDLGLRTLNYYRDGERAMTLGTFWALCAELGVTREEAARRVSAHLATSEHPHE